VSTPGNEEREETPQERADEEIAEHRRLTEEQSEKEAEPLDEHFAPTDDVRPSMPDEEEDEGRTHPAL
jgi:hypothetical protein